VRQGDHEPEWIDMKGVMLMPCPDCGCSVGEFHSTYSVEAHGLDRGPYETFHEEFVICRAYDGRFDVADWSVAAAENGDIDSNTTATFPDDATTQGLFSANDHAASGA
jgi:hypothetical protein